MRIKNAPFAAPKNRAISQKVRVPSRPLRSRALRAFARGVFSFAVRASSLANAAKRKRTVGCAAAGRARARFSAGPPPWALFEASAEKRIPGPTILKSQIPNSKLKGSGSLLSRATPLGRFRAEGEKAIPSIKDPLK